MLNMKTEYQKMLDEELYDASDNELLSMRIKARAWMKEYNQTDYDKIKREQLLQQLFVSIGKNVEIQTPLYVDYGCHIKVGDYFFANFNCVFLDCNYIKMGNYVLLGPNVQMYGAHHPVHAHERIKGPELASPIIIGDNVWIGGGSIICAGVAIGDNTTIGAGSVVVKNIPSNVVAVGNPCRVIKNL